LVRDGPYGWLFDPLDIHALAALLAKVNAMEDETILNMVSAAQSYVVEQFNDDVIHSDLNRIYTKVIA